MQLELLQNFIKAYESTYNQHFDESFKGKIQALALKLNEPFMHLNQLFIEELNSIISSLDKPIKVGIIGQFSSGKSSLLNLILQRPCLPTGAVPVTSKLSFLRYAKNYCLKISFKDGSDELVDVEELENYADQRKEGKEAKSLSIYAPINLLQKITLIDTPGLNANDEDNESTFKELFNTHSIIWLSLIDNAGKKSEEDAIKANLRLLEDNQSICVLNQKDKLSSKELDRVVEYARTVFGGYFDKLIAISCKEAESKESYERSNFKALLDHLQNLDETRLKKLFVKRKILHLCSFLEAQYEFFDEVFDNLEGIFKDFSAFLQENNETIEQKIIMLQAKILGHLKAVAEKISKEILNSVRKKEAHFYKQSKGFLHKGLFERYDYEAPFISSDDSFLAMFYHSDTMNKEFKKMRGDIEGEFKLIKENLHLIFEQLEKKIMLFKAEFSNIQKDESYQSDLDYALLASFCSASDELFLKDFKELLDKNFLDFDLFFEKLNLKALANYESATKLSLGFFSQKINESRIFYELDSSEFTLYYPKINEIYERVLTELNVYEFEALLVDKPLMLKGYKKFFEDFKELISKKLAIIMDHKKENSKRRAWLLDIQKGIKGL
ncbi:dynamin family protein [Campylobacter troglodytis]|uniref:dynamin family protein n=1 Tax=Campylobacter troglodytis TaxID=654363 RepID=UPI0011589AA2|nr:dynamin family protein [Campylobacter troglodytis]TQR54204.1 ATP-binding protein [Campylobacter troglodytis]